MPKLKPYVKKGETHSREQLTYEKAKQDIQLTVKAIEGDVMCSCISMNLLQVIAVHYSERVPALFFRYLKIPS